MNSRYRFIAFSTVSLFLFIILFESNFLLKKKTAAVDKTNGSLAVEGRAEYEYNMLKDPATGKIPANIRAYELAFAHTLPNAEDGSYKTEGNILHFQSRGPWNFGGRTRAVALDIKNENIILAGSVSGGMYRSTNGGKVWKKVSELAENPSVTSVVQDTRAGKENVWYYSTGEGTGTSASGSGAGSFYIGNGVFKSYDNGLTWSRLTSTSSNTPQSFDDVRDITWNMAIDVSNQVDDEVYLASYGAVYRSINGGTSWNVVRGSSSSSPYSYYSDIVITKTGVVYVYLSSDGTQKGIFRSTDGTTWTNITPVGFPSTHDRMLMALNPQNENELYILGETPNSGLVTYDYKGTANYHSLWKYTYVTGDGSGANGTWEDRSLNLPNSSNSFDNFSTQGGYDIVIKVKPDASNTLVIGGTNLYVSTDAFATANNTLKIGGYGLNTSIPFYTLYPNHHPDQHNFIFLPSNPNVGISACDGGLYKTENIMNSPTVNWTELNTGYLASQLYTLAIHKEKYGDNTIAAGAQDNGTFFTYSSSPTAPWTMPSLGDGSYCEFGDNGRYYFSRQQGSMMMCTMRSDGYANQYARIDPAFVDSSVYNFINPFTLDQLDKNIMYVIAGNKIIRNNNLAAFTLNGNFYRKNLNWDSLPNTSVGALKITAITACNNSHRIYYGTSNKKVFKLDDANIGNPTPVEITSSFGFPSGYVSNIAVDPYNDNKLLVVFSNYSVYSLFYSDNAGNSWTKCAGNLEQVSSGAGNGPSLRWASIMSTEEGNRYILGTSTGVYMADTLTGLATVWTQQGAAEFGNIVVPRIETRNVDGLVVVATHGNGIYTAHQPFVTTGIRKNSQKESSFPTFSIFPNPVNEFATFRMNINREDRYVISIYDSNGKQVRELLNMHLKVGIHSIVFDRVNLEVGMYFAELRSEKNKEIIKVMLQ